MTHILFHYVTRSLALKMQMQLLYILPVLVQQVVSQQLGWDHTKQIERIITKKSLLRIFILQAIWQLYVLSSKVPT